MNRRDEEGIEDPAEGDPGTEPARDAPELDGDPRLRALHEELSGIRIEERPSFGPELHRELQRRWRTRRRSPAGPARRTLALAAGVVLLLTGLTVPPARAALVRLIQAVDLAPAPEPASTAPAPVTLPGSGAGEEEAGPVPDPPPVTTDDAAEEVEAGLPMEEVTVYPTRSAPPEIWDRGAARAVIGRFYPADLYEAGIGGVVGLLIWVDREGRPSQFRVDRSSGIAQLDRAALMAAPRLRFLPARRNGEAVGTWVAFNVRFDPDELRPRISGLLVAGPGEEIAPSALAAAMPLPAILPEPPGDGTMGILVKLDDLPATGEGVELRVALERGEGHLRQRSRVPFRLQGEEAFHGSRELPVERIPQGVLYLTADLSGVPPGRYGVWVQVHVRTRGEVLEATAPVTVR